MNDVDRNDEKAVSGRLIAYPSIKGLQFGGSYARGALSSATASRRDRAGLEAAFTRGWFGARSEFLTGWDGVVPRQGYYALAMARLNPRLQAVVRNDVWDPDTRTDLTAATVTETDWLAGLNYQPSLQKVLLQFNYVHKTFMGVQPSRHLFLTNVQTTW
jgi:hypothetical protein